MPSITATCRTRATQERTSVDPSPTGIDKAPVDQLEVTTTGAVGDEVLDVEHHGGIDKALYAYADEDADWWAGRLGEPVPPGRFGENLRTAGVDLQALVIGTRLRAGEVELEVSEPRVPCATFQHHMDDRRGWVKDFTRANRTGTYLRVTRPGTLQAGTALEVLDVPAHGVTIGGWFAQPDVAAANALLAAERDSDSWTLPAALREAIDRVLAG